ncbi:COR domain-containing protein [uncultured Microscilla sp.]|uniref:COR domain-containing protein n=1 Tax=uncultured Microscilla sp. TaxID=432653 RepID=UPI0026165747|nr:COR domain-containing protein [uncultured Microscilla sp.]
MGTLAEQLILESIELKKPVLDLGNCGLRGNEPELKLLAKCIHTRVLNFSSNWINDVVEERLPLVFSSNTQAPNHLTQLPAYLPPHLHTFIAQGNSEAPWSIKSLQPLLQLKALKRLDIGHNQLMSLKALENLPQLTYLFASHNQITEIEPIAALTQLEELFLDTNQLNNVEALTGLHQLKRLSIMNNKIAQAFVLPKCHRLRTIWLSYNQITEIIPNSTAEQLTYLDLRFNQIEQVSLPWLKALPALKTLNLGGNMLNNIPAEILKQGLEGIKNYLVSVNKKIKQRELNEAKLIFVGVGEVGKTELAEALSQPNYEFREGRESTKGIQIKHWKLPNAKREDKAVDFVANIWDFAGQEINYGTHQFFLTKNSVYVFVWDARKDEAQSKFNYWLHIVTLLSDKAPIIVVQNKIDEYRTDINRQNWRKAFPNIIDFVKTSCKTGEGIDTLRQMVIDELLKLPNTREIWNKDRFAVRETLENHPDDYIGHKDYMRVCYEQGLSREDARFLAQQLHDIGVILHFKNAPELKDTVVLKPEWATKAAYQLLDHYLVLEQGKFTDKRLDEVWNEACFDDKHHFLLGIMERFELVFRLNNTNEYIVPERLPVLAPAPVVLPDNTPPLSKVLRFEYHYEFMPKGIFSRFICRIHYLIKEELFWKNGVILKADQSQALISLNDVPAIKTIQIAIWGKQTSELLSTVRHHFDYLHQQLHLGKDLLHEKIPCSCEVCTTGKTDNFDYQHLQNCLQDGDTHIRCLNRTHMAIADLLHGIASQPASLKHLLYLIDTGQISEFFAAADQLGKQDRDLNALRNQFIHEGTRDYQYTDRLKVWVSRVYGGD